jgi:hypothetical protein
MERDCLKHWESEYKNKIKKKRHIELDPIGGRYMMQIDAAMI